MLVENPNTWGKRTLYNPQKFVNRCFKKQSLALYLGDILA